MTSTEGNESHEPSRGLLAGGHPLPSLRPHKHRNCISRSAVMDEHPRPVSPKPGATRTGQPFEIIFGPKCWTAGQCVLIPERWKLFRRFPDTGMDRFSIDLDSRSESGQLSKQQFLFALPRPSDASLQTDR